MKKIEVITKENCSRCETFKKWLHQNGQTYSEIDIEKEENKTRLLGDPTFIDTFCDIEGCMVLTPVLYLPETGKYYGKELFGINGIRDKFVKSVLK